MIVKEFQIVVNSKHGGFHLDTEIALWLMEHKHWRVIEDGQHYETDKYDLVGMGDFFWPTRKYNETEFRMNQDLIECIKELQKKYDLMSWVDRRKCQPKVLDFCIEVVEVHVEVEDVHDGIEKVKSWVVTSQI